MAVTLYAGLTMVTNVPFYSFKDLGERRSVPFIVLVLIALAIAAVNLHPPIVLFGAVLPVRAVGLCGLRLAQDQGPAGERDRNRRPTSPTSAACTREEPAYTKHSPCYIDCHVDPPSRHFATASRSASGALISHIHSISINGPSAHATGRLLLSMLRVLPTQEVRP